MERDGGDGERWREMERDGGDGGDEGEKEERKDSFVFNVSHM